MNGATPPVQTTSRDRIALAAALALYLAGVLLAAVVLPAEYGRDPLGTGRVLGLTALGEVAAVMAETGGTPLEPVRPGANTPQPVSFRPDTRTFQLAPSQGIEFKYALQQGAGMVYSWTASGRVHFDFHGEPEDARPGYAENYQLGDDVMGANGTFFAPSTGIHGWFWENRGTEDVTVTLTSAGFFTTGTEFSAAGVFEHEIPAR